MLKILLGFVIFAALAIFVVLKGGSSLDMAGEKHGEDATHAAPAEAASAATAPALDASAAK